MIPLKDDVPSNSVPFVTVLLIGLNVLAFLYQLSLGIDTRGPGAGAAEAFVFEFGVIPCRLTDSCPAVLSRVAGDFPHPWVTIVTSMFLHGGLLHIAGNMLYLWVFGNNVEDRMGPFPFLLFYLAAGIVAAYAQVLPDPDSLTPLVGASGAIAGALGAYLVMFPHARVLTLVPIFFFLQLTELPAVLVLGFWFVLQALQGVGSLQAETGVAWFAHIGGFIFGAAVALLFRRRRPPQPSYY
jgi:membrane associated rhomboid family serine protease